MGAVMICQLLKEKVYGLIVYVVGQAGVCSTEFGGNLSSEVFCIMGSSMLCLF